MRGILEHSISAGVVSDDEKNAFALMKYLAILIGCLLTTPGMSRHLVSIYEASQKSCSKYKIEMSSIDGSIPIIHKAVEQINGGIQGSLLSPWLYCLGKFGVQCTMRELLQEDKT